MSEQKKRILVIEDEEFLRQALAQELREAGLEVIEARDGKQGMSLITKENPDLVLLDLMLPKMPGEQILKEMNETGLIKKIPVVVTSVKADEASAKNCLEMWGAEDYLVKSDCSLQDIVARVKKYLK